MAKVSLPNLQSSTRDLQTEEQKKRNNKSSKFIFNREAIIRKRSIDIGKKYIYGDKIGEGSFGEVFKVIHRELNFVRALKITKKNSDEFNSLTGYEELEILKKLDHPNILKIYEYFQTDTQWLIITDYFQGKQLFDQIIQQKKLTERKAALIFAQICKAVAYIHAHSIAHRDIKPENIIIKKRKITSSLVPSQGYENNTQDLDEYEIKLIDWGLGIKTMEEMIRRCGSPQYCAPEVLEGSYGHECDLWSLGVLLHVMLTGRFPYKGKNVGQTLKLSREGNLIFKSKYWEQISHQAKYLISCLMKKNPQQRLKAAQVLKSQWILYHISKLEQAKLKRQIAVTEKNLQQTLIRLKQVTVDNKFQAVVINFIHNYMISTKKQQKLKQQFEILDSDKNGVLSYQQLLTGYSKIFPHLSIQKMQEIVLEIFINLDLNGSGSIQYNQFITFATKINRKFTQQQLREVFSLLDYDGNGQISKKQINDIIMYERGTQCQQFDQILNQIDLDGNGNISFEEFMKNVDNAVSKVIKKNRQSKTKRKKSQTCKNMNNEKNTTIANQKKKSNETHESKQQKQKNDQANKNKSMQYEGKEMCRNNSLKKDQIDNSHMNRLEKNIKSMSEKRQNTIQYCKHQYQANQIKNIEQQKYQRKENHQVDTK